MGPRLSYSLFMLLSVGAFFLARRLQPNPAPALPPKQRKALGLAAFVGGVFGAKLGYLLANLDDWSLSASWLADGKTILTGITCAYAAVEATKLAQGIRVKTGDGFAFPLAAALTVGRWGCFFNGCCYGTPTDLPWGVVFHDDLHRHPTQIYESLFHGGMAIFLYQLARRDVFRTHRLQLYLIAYCIFRFLTEYIRPEPSWLLGLTFYQWNSILLASAMAAQWAWDERASKRSSMAAGLLV